MVLGLRVERSNAHLPRRFHALPEAEVHDGEDEEEAEHELPADTAHIP